MKPLFSQYKLKKKEFNKLFLAIVDTQQESVFWILPWAKQWYGQWKEPYYLFLLIEKNQTMIKKKKVNLLVYYTVSPFNKHVFFFDKHVLTNPFFIRITNCIRKDQKKKKTGFKEISTCDKWSVLALPSSSASLAVVADNCFFNTSVSSDKDFNSCSLLSTSFVFSSSCSSNAVVLCLAFSWSLSRCISLSFSVRR